MNDTSAHIATLDQADEEILTYTVSDDALEAAATAAGAEPTHGVSYFAGCCSVNFCR